MYVHVGEIPEQECPKLAAAADSILLRADGSIQNFIGYLATRTDQSEEIIETYGRKLRHAIPGEWAYALITQVRPQGAIPVHHDVPLEDTVRYHLVLQTNPLSWVMHGGEWQQLPAGGIFQMIPNIEHAAVNFGAVPRTHLVVDVKKETNERDN